MKKIPVAPKPELAYRLLGVDPGTNVLGFAVLEVRNRQLKLIELDVLHLSAKLSHHERLGRIFETIQKVIDEFRPTEMAIEAPFFGKNVQSMLKLGRAQGVAIAAGLTRGLSIAEYPPKRIKQSVTGNGNAAKEQVAAMLGHILQLDLSGQILDATDALAAAVFHYYSTNSPGGGSKKYSGWGDFLKDNPDRSK